MAEQVEVVIKIPKYYLTHPQDYSCLAECVRRGTPLPKGHGRLIDAEKLAKEINRAWTLWEKKGEDCYLFSDVLTPMLISQKTIVEADKEKVNCKKTSCVNCVNHSYCDYEADKESEEA